MNITKGLRDCHEAIDFYSEPRKEQVDLSRLTRAPGVTSEATVDQMDHLLFSPNQWPLEPSDFRSRIQHHFDQMETLGAILMEVMTDALKLPRGFFQPLTDRSFWCSRIIGYPPLQSEALDFGLSCGEHTDYGCWTILSQDDTPGALEAEQADGTWTKVEPIPGTFVINLGDMLSVWTNGRYGATPHRVRHTKQDCFRTSIAFFYEPNFDAEIWRLPQVPVASEAYRVRIREERLKRLSASATTEPLQRALGGGGLVYGEHLFAKVASNFDFEYAGGRQKH